MLVQYLARNHRVVQRSIQRVQSIAIRPCVHAICNKQSLQPHLINVTVSARPYKYMTLVSANLLKNSKNISGSLCRTYLIMDVEKSEENQDCALVQVDSPHDASGKSSSELQTEVLNTVISSVAEKTAENHIKHKFDEALKEPLRMENASKKLKLGDEVAMHDDLPDNRKDFQPLLDEAIREKCQNSGQANEVDISVCSEGLSDWSMSVMDETKDFDISDTGGKLDSVEEAEKVTESKDGDWTTVGSKRKSCGRAKQLDDTKAREKAEEVEAKVKDWWETLSRVPDMFLRLKACQDSEDFKKLMLDMKKPKKNFRKGRHGRVSPNHFISLQITSEEINAGIKKAMESILERDGDLSSAMISPATLHITLMVMHLTEEQLPSARDILEEVKEKINKSAWLSEQIHICGMGTFRDQVVFGKIKNDDGYKQLEFMKDITSRCYLGAGISSTDRRSFNPHLTVMKLSKAGNRTKVKKIPAEYYKEFAEFDFGGQPITELQLCAMMKPKDSNGYYQIEHKIDIRKPESQGDGPIYFEKLEKNLNWVAHEAKIDVYPFFGNEFPFSNHHDAKFFINGLQFTTSEQWYMLCKAMFHEQYNLALRVLETSNPKAQKRLLGHLPSDHKGRSWDATAKRVMTFGVTAKFTQNRHLADQLLETGDKVLVEASPNDRRWGVGLNKNNPKIFNPDLWRGDNWLGHILMAVREGLQKGYLHVIDSNEESSLKVTWDPEDLPVIVEPKEWCNVFLWNKDDLPILAPGHV